MDTYIINDREWERVLNELENLEKENEKLKGVIVGMEKALSLSCANNLLLAKRIISFTEWKNIRFNYSDESYQDLGHPRVFYTQEQVLKKYIDEIILNL